MKRMIVIFLALLLLLTACGGEEAEKPTETQAPTYSNEGPEGILDDKIPHTVYKLVRVVSQDEKGEEQWHREFIYDSHGFCTEELEVTSAGTVTYRHVNTPNEAGLTASTSVTESSGISYTLEYTYDAAGNVIRQQTIMDGQVAESTEYTYDDRGNYLTLKQYYYGELVLDYSFSYTYNSDGTQSARDEYLAGELLSHVEFTYDDQGRETGSVSSIAGGASQSRTESTWEGLTETRAYFGMGDTEPYMTSVRTYDDHGNVIMEESQYSGGAFTILEYSYEPFEVVE